MQTIRTIIVDDERYACERLKKLLVSYPQIHVIDSFTNSKEGLENIVKHKPDLLFLDVELENGNSAFDIIDQLKNSNNRPNIILVTRMFDKFSLMTIWFFIYRTSVP